jgi:hypothetical protein
VKLEKFHRPRWAVKIVAASLSYFWLPCPNCGKMFAGFESGRGSGPPDANWCHQMWCWRCDGKYAAIMSKGRSK